MAQSLSSIYLHAIFSTKQRHPFLQDPALRREVHAYLAGVSKRLDCPAVLIGGVEDHVHSLVRFGKGTTVADWMREIKRLSSGFVKQHDPDFAWQAGHGLFSVTPSDLPRVTAYIASQEEHHRKVSFQDEFRQLMREQGIELDERYVWE